MKDELEEIVIEKIRNGDARAFRYLVDKYKGYVFNVSIKILKNREEAEEAGQDSFMKAFKSIGEFRKESKFSTWLYRVAFNNAIARTRKKTLNAESIESEEDFKFTSDIAGALESLGRGERTGFVKKAMDMLNEEDSILINLYYWQENSMAEVSEITGLEENLVKVKIHRARQKLQKHISNGLGIKIEDLL